MCLNSSHGKIVYICANWRTPKTQIFLGRLNHKYYIFCKNCFYSNNGARMTDQFTYLKRLLQEMSISRQHYSRINLLNLGSCHIYYACVTFIFKRCWNVPEHTHCYEIIFCIDSVLFSDLFLDWNTNILQMYARKCSEYLDEKTHKINIYKI